MLNEVSKEEMRFSAWRSRAEGHWALRERRGGGWWMGEGDTVVRTLGTHEKLDRMAGDAFSGAFEGGRRRAAERIQPGVPAHTTARNTVAAAAPDASRARSVGVLAVGGLTAPPWASLVHTRRRP